MSYNISKSKYKQLRTKYDSHMKAFESYRKKTGSNSIGKEEEKKYNIPKGTTGKETSQIEIYEYKNKPLQVGDSYFAYLSTDGNEITTFTGDKLAKVENLTETKDRGYDKHYSFSGIDINGNKIRGRAYSGKGGYVRMRRVE